MTRRGAPGDALPLEGNATTTTAPVVEKKKRRRLTVAEQRAVWKIANEVYDGGEERIAREEKAGRLSPEQVVVVRENLASLFRGERDVDHATVETTREGE